MGGVTYVALVTSAARTRHYCGTRDRKCISDQVNSRLAYVCRRNKALALG